MSNHETTATKTVQLSKAQLASLLQAAAKLAAEQVLSAKSTSEPDNPPEKQQHRSVGTNNRLVVLVALACIRKVLESGSGLARAMTGKPQPVAGDAVGGEEFGETEVHGSISPTTNHTSQHTPRHLAAQGQDPVIEAWW